MTADNPYRLPRTVVPTRYELTLTPDLNTASFTGDERVSVSVVEPTKVIKLNAIELDLLSATVIDSDGNEQGAVIALDEESETATLTVDSQLTPGDHTVRITFTGTLNDKLRGFYRSTFKDDNGTEHTIATTQFESTDARRAFPCWDEPDFKAVFSVTLIVDETLAAFSNGAVAENEPLGNGKRQVRFADTMIMSTYLVAFVVGPLVETEVIDVDGTPLRIACVPGREPLARFSLEAGAAALRFFTDYFGIGYPGGKLDLISLPDFAFGAMENLGCVTFRETALLVDDQNASRGEIERVADVVGHEIAHMWFGDLVTMKWWNGIWLNEAFATFMEISFVHHFRPEWERWVSFGLEKGAAMTIDSLQNTRPIEFTVVRPEEAQGMFDLLTYQKGGAVLRMLEQHMDPEVFRKGIQLYLSKHAYKNAETTDLWDALEASSGQPVRAMMDSWIFQGGHPIVHAAKEGDTLKLSQRRFRYLDESQEESPLWHVPIGVRTAAGETKTLLTDKGGSVELPSGTTWVVANAHANGFYRVSYDANLFRDLLANLDTLEPIERFSLISDAWAACLSGDVALTDVLDLIRLLSNDSDPNVWSAMLAPIALVDKVISDSQRPQFVEFVRAVTRPMYEKLGWEPQASDEEQTGIVRGVVISALGGVGEDEEVRKIAAERYSRYQNDKSALDPNIVGAVEGVLAATNESEHYDTLVSRFKNISNTPQEQVRALGALATFTDAQLVDRTLDMIVKNEVRSQDAPYAIRVMLSRRSSGAKVWEWCEQQWPALTERFPDNSITRMFDGVSAQADAELADRIQTFMASHPVPQAQKSVDQTCERLRVNVAWAARNRAAIGKIFS